MIDMIQYHFVASKCWETRLEMVQFAVWCCLCLWTLRRTSFKFPWSCPQFRRLRSSRTLRCWRVLIHFDTITVNRSDACMRLLGCLWLIQQIHNMGGPLQVYGGNLYGMRQDAIESLSPEQKAFAKAFRALQLESTLFGILAPCIGRIWEDIGLLDDMPFT